MPRLIQDHRFRVDRIDLMLVCGLAAVIASYGLGYRLDWAQAGVSDSENVEAEEGGAWDAAGPEALPRAAIAPEALAAAAAIPSPKIPSGRPQPPALPPVDFKAGAWREMTAELGRLAGRYRGRVAIFLKDLKTNETWTYHPDDLFPSASLIKVPVMASAFYRIQEGRMSLYDRLTLRRRNRMGGSGSLKWRPDGTKLTVRELLQLMISESDNTATSMVLEAAGMGYVQQQFPKMGLFYTGIYPEGMSIRGTRVANENYTTAREMTMLMEKIYRGELVDRPSSELMFDILKHKKAVASRLAKGLPPGWEIAHKTGLLRQACHDSAIFLTPHGDYALTVLTGQNSNYRMAKNFISRLGRITFRHYRAPGRYYAKAPRRPVRIAVR